MSRPNAPPLSVRNLAKSYRGATVLRDVSFELRAGEAMALIGANGSGKSTLLGCLSANRLPDAGDIRVSGNDPFSDPGAVAGCMGFVPEHPFLYEELTVGELLQFVAQARLLDVEASEREADRLFRLFGLAEIRLRVCGELSQGMGRKVALTMALLHRPEVLVLDEATNGLDRPSVQGLMAELSARRAQGAAALLSSHDLEVLAEHCDRGLLLAPGGEWTLLEGDAWSAWAAQPALVGAAGTTPEQE